MCVRICLLLGTVVLAYDAQASQSESAVTKDRFHITVDAGTICICDRETKQELSVEAPEWLKKQKTEVALDPDNRFFVIYNHQRLSRYALNHKIWKLGTPLKSIEYFHPKDTDLTSVSICTNDDWCFGMFLAKMRLRFTSPPDETGFQKNYTNDVYISYEPHRWDTEDEMCKVLISSVQRVRRCLQLAKGLVVKTSMPPHALRSHCPISLKDDYRAFVACERALNNTQLKPQIIQRMFELVEKRKLSEGVMSSEAIARMVLDELL